MVILICLIIILIIFVIGSKLKLHPFLLLFISSLLIGAITNQNILKTTEAITSGFSSTIKNIGYVIAFGTLIGTILEESKATYKIATSLSKLIGLKKADTIMNLTGFIVSIPVFCDSGYIILSPLNKELHILTKIPLTILSISLATGLYASHVFIPPTPGPLALSSILNIDIGLLIIFGTIIGLPTSILGLLWAKFIGGKINLNLNDEINIKSFKTPPLYISILPIFIPVILLSLKNVSEIFFKEQTSTLIYKILSLFGNPIIALFIGFMFCLPLIRYINLDLNKIMTDSIKNAGVIILITGAGGSLGYVLKDINIENLSNSTFTKHNFGFLAPFLLSAILKTAQGSSTVSMITSASIFLPTMDKLGYITPTDKLFTALAISAGSMMISHMNDSYFWIISQFSNLKPEQTIKTFTIASIIQSIFAIFLIHAIYFIFN